MTDDPDRDEAGPVSEPQLVRAPEVFLPAALAAYRARRRRADQWAFDPEAMRPRWRYARVAGVVLAVVLVAGFATPVPVGVPGTVLWVDGDLLTVVGPSEQRIEHSTVVRLQVGDDRFTATVLEQQRVEEEGQIPLVVTVVELDQGAVVSQETVGGPAMLEQGTRPLLLDIVLRGRA